MGRQFLVNQYQNNWQRESDVLALPSGGFMVVWSSYFNNYDDGFQGTIISGRRFDAAGRPVTGEFVIDAIDGTASQTPSITALTGGGYAIASAFSPTDDILGATQAWVRHFNANGTPRGPDSRVDTPTPAEDQYEASGPEVAGLANGGSLVFYEADQSDPTFDDIYLRRFDALGRPVGVDQVVNTNVRGRDQLEVEAVTLRNGNVIAIWNSEDTLPGPNGSLDFEIRGSLYSPTGALIRADFHLTRNIGVISPFPGLSGDFDVTPLLGGGFAISRFDYGTRYGTGEADPLLLQIFDAAGRLTRGPVIAHLTQEVQFDSEVVQLAGGDIVVVWEQYPINGDVGEDLYGRIFSADGRALTGMFQVGQNFDGYDTQEDPSLAALAGGGFVVTYTHDNLDADNDAVGAQIFGQATAGNDVAIVDASGYLNGAGGNDRLTGDARANGIFGGPGADVLLGLNGPDVLTGGLGRDQMFGGLGADDFVLNLATSAAAPPDLIGDLRPDDDILLENAVFAGLGAAGALRADLFRVLGRGAVDASDRILYDAAGGWLFHDPDGSGPAARRAIAQIADAPALGLEDFMVI